MLFQGFVQVSIQNIVPTCFISAIRYNVCVSKKILLELPKAMKIGSNLSYSFELNKTVLKFYKE